MIASLTDSSLCLCYRTEHWKHHTSDFREFLGAIELFGSQRYGGPKSLLALGGGGKRGKGEKGKGLQADGPVAKIHLPNPAGRCCTLCVSFDCKAGSDPALCIVANDALSLKEWNERQTPLRLLHVLSQRIWLLEPGGADKVKAGDYVLHRLNA